MFEGDEGIVVRLGPRPATIDFGVDADGRPEQHDGLVDQVGAEVSQLSPALIRVPTLPPALADFWPEPLEPGFEPDDLPETSLAEQCLDRQEVPVPAAVL